MEINADPEEDKNYKLGILFKTFELTSNEYYKNGENRWKYFATIGTALSGFIFASLQFPIISKALLLVTMILSIGGLIMLISIYRIIVAIDVILTNLQKVLVKKLLAEQKRISRDYYYPESNQFLKGFSYLFSIHNGMAFIYSGFFTLSFSEYFKGFPFFKALPNISWIILVVCIWSLIILCVWKFSNVRYKKLVLK
jgi:hypothetical protein